MQEYHSLFPGVIWTGLNIDYPGHSFDHLGIFYEGVNGRLPNQDVINAVAHCARWDAQLPTRRHNVEDRPPDLGWILTPLAVIRPPIQQYILGAKHLWEHFKYTAFGRASAAHGVLSRSVFCL